MKKNKVTIEDLAGMVQGGFDDMRGEMNKRFDKIEDWQRLANGRFDVLEMELMDIKKKLDEVIYRNEFEHLRERVERLEHLLTQKKK